MCDLKPTIFKGYIGFSGVYIFKKIAGWGRFTPSKICTLDHVILGRNHTDLWSFSVPRFWITYILGCVSPLARMPMANESSGWDTQTYTYFIYNPSGDASHPGIRASQYMYSFLGCPCMVLRMNQWIMYNPCISWLVVSLSPVNRWNISQLTDYIDTKFHGLPVFTPSLEHDSRPVVPVRTTA